MSLIFVDKPDIQMSVAIMELKWAVDLGMESDSPTVYKLATCHVLWCPDSCITPVIVYK